jgi:hypothetical protein
MIKKCTYYLKRINYLKYLLENSKDKLEEIEGLEEIEKYL